VCDPDEALQRVLLAPLAPSRRRGAGRPAQATPVEPVGDPVDESEFERLRAWRWERAEGKPAYTVAANKVLEEVLRRRPRTAAELIEIKGIGGAFCEKHGESLLGALRALGPPGAAANAGAGADGQAPRDAEAALA
jgi:ATP-dependent DNA helicase RecQ